MKKVLPSLHEEHHDFLHRYFANASKEELFEAFLKHLNNDHKLTHAEVADLLNEAKQHEATMLPINIFQTEHLSALEAIVKFLKETKGLTFHDIATILNRNDRTIWTTYAKSRKKMLAHFHLLPSKYHVPAKLFATRKLSVLETITTYLRHTLGLTLHDIAQLLNRDDRTIWTVCSRADKKVNK
ncbi:hypothetical protein HY492_02165 [Candidatus Woesearchaeota archaeon]|nr:hypothetical protein [Candidatus Woesearchaeota archaeon]